MNKPNSPADPRDGEPYYIDSECPDCGTELRQVEEARERGWHDEWECPNCLDGIHMDWPESELERLQERAKQSESIPIEETDSDG